MNKIIIGYERSGRTRNAFRALGINAWSCDILPSKDNSPYHIIADIFSVLNSEEFSMGIFHPLCTYLTNAAAWAFTDGPYHQKVAPGTLVGQARRDARELALNDVKKLLSLPYPKAVENPKGAISTNIRPSDQFIHPFQFGDDASKETHLWLDRLPKLIPTKFIEPRRVNGKYRWANQTDSGQNNLPPSENRAELRSETYPGIAAAFAQQWYEYAR